MKVNGTAVSGYPVYPLLSGMIMDVFGRKVVGWEVYDRECEGLASSLLRRAVMAEGCQRRPDILHADNGSPQK